MAGCYLSETYPSVLMSNRDPGKGWKRLEGQRTRELAGSRVQGTLGES